MPPRAVVAGHICLDIIPSPAGERGGAGATVGGVAPGPGELEVVGPAGLAVGGCVGNTGLALHRLGLATTLVARIGDDELGGILGRLVAGAAPGAARLVVGAGDATSYSVIDSRPGQDRAIRHFPGANDRFTADDVPADVLRGATIVHVGYPPLMAALRAGAGAELVRLLARAHDAGALTSLDMAAVTIDPSSGPDWRGFLEQVLPAVDVFLPSLEEAAHLLGREAPRDPGGRISLDGAWRLATELLALGPAVAGLKLGADGLVLRAAGADRLARAAGRLTATWAGRELHAPVFEVEVAGTTGAGDATIAGFLYGLATGMSLDGAATAACAAGGASTEAVDGSSAIPPWPVLEARIRSGWRRREPRAGPRVEAAN